MHVEICLHETASVTNNEMQEILTRVANENIELFKVPSLSPQMIPFPNPYYATCITSINIEGDAPPIYVHCYRLSSQMQSEDKVDNDGEILSLSTITLLPSLAFENMWDSIIIEDDDNEIKNTLLNFMETSLTFSDHGICPDTITCNRIILLYGPPGTGKTTICHGLAQKLSIRLSHRFARGVLVEVNTHSIFSKWFAESGKMVKRLFDRLRSIASDQSTLVFVLIDEVESIATARQSSMNGSDPSDSIRVVNALLTQIDQLRRQTNVVIFATSNLTECIDFAFLSRADIKQYIGLPCLHAIYNIFAGCIDELVKKRVLLPSAGLMEYNSAKMFAGTEITDGPIADSIAVMKIAARAVGLSGRVLRRLPMLAFVRTRLVEGKTTLGQFTAALSTALDRELASNEKTP